MGARPYRTLRSWPYKPGQSQGLPLHGMGVYDPEIYRRRSMRLKGYDYTQAGAYLVTIVVQGRFPPFGAVADGRMRLNGAVEMVRRIWTEMPNRFPSIKMDAFITMPNHIHGIIILVGAPLVGAQPVTDVTGRRIPARATTRVAPTMSRLKFGECGGEVLHRIFRCGSQRCAIFAGSATTANPHHHLTKRKNTTIYSMY